MQGSGREQADFFILLRSLREYRYPRWRSKLLLQAHFCDINVLESLRSGGQGSTGLSRDKGWLGTRKKLRRAVAHILRWQQEPHARIFSQSTFGSTLLGSLSLELQKGKKSTVVENVRLFCYPEGARLKTFLLTFNLCPLQLAPISKGRCQKLPRGFC